MLRVPVRGFTLRSEAISKCLSPDVLIEFIEKLRTNQSVDTKVPHWNIRVNSHYGVNTVELDKTYKLTSLDKRYLLVDFTSENKYTTYCYGRDT